jgi:DNA-binding winged helix-turn-helix (wHTH) protein
LSGLEATVRLQFGAFDLDLESRQLLRAGDEVVLPPKAFLLLELLVVRRPRALSRAQIRDHLWPGTFVSESNLNTLVTQIRTALEDDAKSPLFVRTVHGFGYAFSGKVRPASPAPRITVPMPGVRLRLFCQDREAALSEGENILGRTDEATVWIDAPTVSRRHARIVVSDGRATLEDLRSRNGTWLRGERIESIRVLADGDEIRLGRVPATFRVLGAGSTRSSSKR